MSQIEGSLAKVDQMEELMTLIASKMGLVPEPINSTLFFHENPSIVPPTPVAVRVRSPAGPRPSHAAPDSQLARVSDSQSAHAASSPALMVLDP